MHTQAEVPAPCVDQESDSNRMKYDRVTTGVADSINRRIIFFFVYIAEAHRVEALET